MKYYVLWVLGFSVALALSAPAAFADSVPIGYASFDVTGTNVAQIDLNNLTGPNSTGDPTFPVSTSVSLSNLSLEISFAGGATETFNSSTGYFSLSSDGISWTGTGKSTISAPPTGLFGADSATLTGTFDTTSLTLYDGSMVTIAPDFSTTFSGSDIGGLFQDGDFGIIDATTSSTPPPPVIPEPSPLILLGTGLLALICLRFRRSFALGTSPLSRLRPAVSPVLGLMAVAGFLALGAHSAGAQSIHLNSWTNPSSGASGNGIVTLTGSGFPSGVISPSSVTLSFSSSMCGGTVAASESPNSVITILGSVKRLSLLVPGGLNTGTYYISVTDGTYASTNCGEINVTHTSTTLSACLPSSSLAVLTGKNVDAYIPHGYWDAFETGISLVPIEGTDAPASIPTSGVVNSCSSNAETGETICVDNGTDVYLLKGASITNTLTSGATGTASFTGGSCQDCGVAIDALTNTAVISEGNNSGVGYGQGVQLLNLANNTFSTPFPMQNTVSENVSIDPNRNLILSPGEDANYTLLKINTDGSLTEYGNQSPTGYGYYFDSAAEDCTTGIALSTEEFSNDLFITDLTQATFTPPSGGGAGTWTAPSQAVYLNTYLLAAGTSGISVAAGTTHLGITTGEFGGNTFVVFQLPSTSGSGIPGLADYAGAVMPNTPDGAGFSAGDDPHTTSAYTSPNDGRAYGVIVDWAPGYPSWVGVIDLQKLLAAPRSSANTVDSTYDLIANGVVRYIAVP